MCGIIGYVGADEVVPVLLDGLRRLEYRGYDSAGMAVLGADKIEILRAAGKLKNLEQKAYHEPLHGTAGVGHTRWATHGAPTEANAHPQTDAEGQVAVVHNGIVENYTSLRKELQEAGVDLQSDTDTELIAQLLGRGKGTLTDRVLAILPRLEGQYAVVAVNRAEPDVVVAFRNGPPLVVGYGDGENLVASDVTALLHRTRRVVFLENGDVAEVRADGVRILDASGSEVERPVETLDWDAARVEKGGYRHFMLKEIFEQPDAIRNTVLANVLARVPGRQVRHRGVDRAADRGRLCLGVPVPPTADRRGCARRRRHPVGRDGRHPGGHGDGARGRRPAGHGVQ